MNTKLFIGNLAFSVSEAQLKEIFSQAGTVVSVAIPVDRQTGRKRGFAFVEMSTQEEAESAIQQFNGQTVEGRQVAVNPSQPREAGVGGGGGGGRSGGGGGGDKFRRNRY